MKAILRKSRKVCYIELLELQIPEVYRIGIEPIYELFKFIKKNILI